MLKVFGNWFPGAAGEALGMVIFTLGLVLWTLIPLFDTRTRGGRYGQQAVYFGLFVLFILILTTAWGYWAVGGKL
jgi:cytochrome b6